MHIFLVVGGGKDNKMNSLDDSADDQVTFIVHSNEPPYTHTNEVSLAKEHFEYAKAVEDVRIDQAYTGFSYLAM